MRVLAKVGGQRWLARGERGSAGFALRLAASFLGALVLACVAGYLFMNSQLHQSQIDRYAEAQRSYARTFEGYDSSTTSRAAALSRINQVLDALWQQDGTLETLLIDRRGVVRASSDRSMIGTRHVDSRISSVLLSGTPYAGPETDPRSNGSNFEFVTPVNLLAGRYALEVTYDHAVLDAQLSELRRGLVLLGLLVLFGGGGAFYLFGGRALLRSHAVALQRATRDGLTDLPNHRAFQDELEQAEAAAARSQDGLALLAFDVDKFKLINDRHGHPHGDEVLRRVAGVIRLGRPGDRGFRIGGDEFALLLPHTDPEGARVMAKRMLRNLREAKVEVTVGVATTRPGQANDLRAEADAALYEAKRYGGNRIAHFEDIREHIALISSDKRSAVHRFLEERRFGTEFQPIWDLRKGALLGVEAFTRPDPAYGFSGPAELFDIAEQIGRVHELDELCATNALASAAELPPDVLVFINICPRTLDLDAGRNDWLPDAAQRAGLDPQRIVVELTERFGGQAAAIAGSLERLRGQGFKIAIDDVGTGNSGLATLGHVKFDFIKIDRGIVAAAPTDTTARAVLLAISTYARQTGSFVIAEGVEDDETLEFLQHIDVHELRGGTVIQGGQGFRLGMPTSAHQACDEDAPPEIQTAA